MRGVIEGLKVVGYLAVFVGCWLAIGAAFASFAGLPLWTGPIWATMVLWLGTRK